MLWFFHVVLFLIMNIYKFCKKQIDPLEEDDETGKKYEDGRESQERIDGSDFDKVAVKRQELTEDATCFDKIFFSLQEYGNYYAPVLILLPLNIITGTSKSFSFVLYFIINFTISFFNIGKIHKRCT